VARGNADEFADEQSGIFEITAPTSRVDDRCSARTSTSAWTGLVFLSVLYGTVTVVAYWQAALQ
jgi:hypothetical protein